MQTTNLTDNISIENGIGGGFFFTILIMLYQIQFVILQIL